MRALVIDFETTDTTDDAQATELAVLPVHFTEKGFVPSDEMQSARCKPERPISYGAMAVTNIFPEDLEGCGSHTFIANNLLPSDDAYIIGHNVDFDIQVAKNAGVDVSQYKAICTLAILRNLYPGADSHTLGAMSCMFDYQYARDNIKNAHGASADVMMTARLLHTVCKIQGIADMQTLYELSEHCRVPTHLNFGKHKGTAISYLIKTQDGSSYLDWLYKSTDDVYLKTAIDKARQ